MAAQPAELKIANDSKTKQELQTFLDHIARGRQDEAEAMLKANKDLALVPGTVTDHAKRTFRNITGFQYAVWALDWKMWTMILPYLTPEAAKEQAQGFKEGAWVKEHAEQANWKNLTDALQVYIDNYDSWTEKLRQKHWAKQVGGAQFKLPIHVLQEYNNPDRPFEPCPKFDVQYPLQRSLPDWLDKGINGAKFHFGILRNDYARCAWGAGSLSSVAGILAGWMDADRSALISLYDNRIQQRGKLVAQILRQVPAIIEPKINAKQLQTFLDHIARGRQDEAETMLKANKELALVPGTVTDHAKRTFRNITGFQYAVWALDWKMWTMLLPYLSPEAAIEQAKGFTQGSWVKEHAEYANWKNLTDALQVYIENYDPWTAEQRKKHWVEQVGGTQFKLPIHVLQEYNNPDRPFEPCPKFDAQYPLQRSLPDWLDKGIKDGKFDFGILRYDDARVEDGGGVGGLGWVGGGVGVADRSALISLYDNRIQQRGELVAQLLRGQRVNTTSPSAKPSTQFPAKPIISPLSARPLLPTELTPEQQFQLGQNYYNGKDVAQNHQTAAQHFQAAANQKHANAQGWLGHCFETGTGIPKDLKKAKEYYQLAEKQGITWVQEGLKRMASDSSLSPKPLLFQQDLKGQTEQNSQTLIASSTNPSTSNSSSTPMLGNELLAFVSDLRATGIEPAALLKIQKEVQELSWTQSMMTKEIQSYSQWLKNFSTQASHLEAQMVSTNRLLLQDAKTKQEQAYIDNRPKLKNYQRRLQKELIRFITCYFLAPAGVFQLEGNKKDTLISAIGSIPVAGSFLKIIGAVLFYANKKNRFKQLNRLAELFDDTNHIVEIASRFARQITLMKEADILKLEQVKYEGWRKILGFFEDIKNIVDQQWRDLATSDTTGVLLVPEDKLAILDGAYLLQQILSGDTQVHRDQPLDIQFIKILTGNVYQPSIMPPIASSAPQITVSILSPSSNAVSHTASPVSPSMEEMLKRLQNLETEKEELRKRLEQQAKEQALQKEKQDRTERVRIPLPLDHPIHF